jgi:hypothetical protein
MTICVLAFLLLALEELFFKLNSQPVTGCIDPRTHSIDHEDTVRSKRVTLLLRWMRMVQLAVLAVIFAMVAASSGFVILFTTSGQLAGLILLLQLARILTRKVVDQWSVLRAVVIMQAVLLVLLAAYGLGSAGAKVPPYRTMDWLMTSLTFFGLFLLSISVAFCSTYFMRLISREGSPIYYSLPPLAFSEYWIRRMIRAASAVTALTLFLHAPLFLLAGYPPGSMILQCSLLAVMLPSLLLFQDRKRLHHPTAVILISLGWVLNMVWTLAGFTASSGNWFD